MMITIHGFPAKTKYQDVKILIKQECNISDFILDNLITDTDGTKKVRIGLADNTEGFKVMKCLDGYRMPGNFVLKAIPIGKAATNQPQQDNSFDSRPNYQNQPRNDYSNAPRNDYMNQGPNDYNNQGSHGPGAPLTHGGIHGSVGPHGPRPQQGGPHSHGEPHVSGGPQGPVDNRPSPWVSAGGNNSNQWSAPMAAQVPQNTFGFNSPQANVNPSYGQQPHQSHPRPGFNQGRAADQGYGYTPKNVPEVAPPVRVVETRHALRSIETVDTSVTHPPIHGRYPPSQSYQQDKPHTIMKDNFQGPTPYNITNPGGQSGSHSGPGGHQSQYSSTVPTPWQSQAQPSKAPLQSYDKQYDDRKYIQPDPRDPKTQPLRPEPQERTYKEYEKRRGFSPRRSPTGRRVSPEPGRRMSPSGRRVSPSGRRVSPPGRRVSPPGRRVSPTGRKFSPSERRISPHARKFSPPGKRISPDRRLPGHHPAAHHPGSHHPASLHPGRHDAPHKRPSPVRRLVSPTRRPSPGRRDEPQRMQRYSPDRHHPDKLDKYGQDKLKQVRPAYEPTAHASNQAMYSGGYRPNNRETVQYPMQGMRQPEPRISPWQRERDDPNVAMKKQEDDRRDMARMQIRDRIPDAAVDVKRAIPPQRKSRSPVRRDRSPLRDRYKRHSPSPRSSHSPRRSWALEKRRSPEIRDAPPPPSWPGQNVRDTDYPRNRPNFPEREVEKTKHVPVWEPRAIDDEPRGRRSDIPEGRRPDMSERRPFIEEKMRPVKEIPVREPVPHSIHNERFVQREPKFSPRDDYDAERRDNYRRREPSLERKPHPQHSQREEFDPARRPRDLEERAHPDDHHRRREPSPRHSSRKDEPIDPAIDKDFEDIYKRALQFKKKAEELRRLGSKRRDDFLEEEHSRSHHSERERDERPQRYEERHRFREEELRARERDERPREDRPRDDGPRRDYHREEYPKERDRIDDSRPGKRFTVSPFIRAKRDKAVEEISNKILDRHDNYRELQGEQRNRVLEELKLAVARIVFDMFGDGDVSFIEIIIKYQAKYNLKDEEKILQEVTASLPSQFRVIKRQGPDILEVPAKTRRSQSPHLKPDKKSVLPPKPQRPPQSLRRRAEPPRSESMRTSPKEAKVTKGPVKTSAVQDNSSAPSRKPATESKKAEEVKKAVAPPAPVESPLQGGHYELNARMTRIVEAELRDIMIKVWQELPDNPSDEAEALVVDKLRNQAGDYLRNVLGLNITKRLLNVHNPLYVKVQFSGKPEKVHLGEFLKKYNFTAFKRIEKTVNMFAAQVKTINDFDKICSETEVKCGDIKVTVTPIYKFTKCPPNLVTNFCDQDEDGSDETTETNEKEDKPDNTKTPENVTVKTENVPAKPKEETKTENSTKDKVVSKPVENKTVVNKPTTENKPVAANKAASKPVVENKTTPNKTAVENKTATNKPAVNNTASKTPVKPVTEKPVANKPTPEKAVTKPTVQNKTVTKPTADVKPAANTTVNKTAVANKPAVVNKTAVANKPVAATKPAATNKPTATNKTVAKPAVQNKEVKKPQATPKFNDSVKKTADKSSKLDDYDELDDRDILALMSEGIVLDECSGSDDE
ncbi:hypothetical protein PYW07_010870 [Mythimna separata]|uniref:Uncharacterized protein n=1 Tax=Mythimna separata TaxID=271217 RepID=A0AAD7Y8H3_MYTSE|nr:hypothetical protein PYW07_010870 [Mythimna separata]